MATRIHPKPQIRDITFDQIADGIEDAAILLWLLSAVVAAAAILVLAVAL